MQIDDYLSAVVLYKERPVAICIRAEVVSFVALPPRRFAHRYAGPGTYAWHDRAMLAPVRHNFALFY